MQSLFYSGGLQAGWSCFDSRKGQEIFLYSTVCRPTLGPTQPPIKWVPGSLFPGVKGLGHEADHSPLSRAEVKNGGAVTLLRHTSSWLGA
jgi:hypothetical protein